MERGQTTAEGRFTVPVSVTGKDTSTVKGVGKGIDSGDRTTDAPTSSFTQQEQQKTTFTGTASGLADNLRLRKVAPAAAERVEALTAAGAERLDAIKKELPRAVEAHVARVQQAVPHSVGEAWHSLPYVWVYTLFSDAFIAWPLLGALMLFKPASALSWHAWLAGMLGWAGPTPALASNTLLMYVQAVGALCFTLAVLSGYAFLTRDAMLARAYSLARGVLGLCLLFAVFFGHPVGTLLPSKTSTVYYALLPFAAHSFWHAGSILTSGPEFWRKLLGRVPPAMQ